MNDFEQKIFKHNREKGLHSLKIDTIQVNVGLMCNQQCIHCHLEASPHRKEVMSKQIMEKIVETARKVKAKNIDITGGAPELNPNLKWFIQSVGEYVDSVQVRTNLTVLHEPEIHSFMEFYRNNKVKLVASMPCYLEENVRAQRGEGVYEKSISAIRELNDLGYGLSPELTLDLAYNPGGDF